MIETRIVRRMGEVPEVAWDALVSPEDPPFLRHAFLDALETTGCVGDDTGWTPAHLLFEEAGLLVAAAPAYVKADSEGEFVFDWSWAELAHRMRIRYYPKLVVAVPFTPATGARILARSGEERLRALPALTRAIERLVGESGLSSVHVLFPTESEARALEEHGLVPRHGVQFHWHNEGYGSFDDWLGTFDAKKRHQIRRERREVERQGIRVETLRGSEITEEALDTIYGMYLAGVDKHVWGRRYLNRSFFGEIARRLPGAIEIVLAREGDRAIAGALNFASKNVLYGRYWGCEEERPFLHFEVCFYHSVEQCIRRGISRFEPGAGGDHKRARGFRPTITYSAHRLGDARLDAVIRRYLVEEREHVAQYVLSSVALTSA
jgi:uncharacterized protein